MVALRRLILQKLLGLVFYFKKECTAGAKEQ